MSDLTESQKIDPRSCTPTQVMPNCDTNATEIDFPIFVESLGCEQLAEELSTFFGKPVSKNTLKNNWFNVGGRIDRIYQGLELPLKTDSGRITPFGINAVFEFAALVHFGSKHYDDYVLSVRNHYNNQRVAASHAANPDKLQPLTPSTPPTSGRLNLPIIQPVNSAIVPVNTSLPTDSQESTTLTQTIEQNSQDLEKIRNLLTQVNAFVDSKIDQLDNETEATQKQATELKDLAFRLEVKQETLRRSEIRNAAARQESEAAKSAATGKVVNLSDFFAKKSAHQSGS